MGKSKKKAMHSQKEEQQAKKVMMTMGVIAIVLVIAMFVARIHQQCTWTDSTGAHPR